MPLYLVSVTYTDFVQADTEEEAEDDFNQDTALVRDTSVELVPARA